jgi:hypothetical protein
VFLLWPWNFYRSVSFHTGFRLWILSSIALSSFSLASSALSAILAPILTIPGVAGMPFIFAATLAARDPIEVWAILIAVFVPVGGAVVVL